MRGGDAHLGGDTCNWRANRGQLHLEHLAYPHVLSWAEIRFNKALEEPPAPEEPH